MEGFNQNADNIDHGLAEVATSTAEAEVDVNLTILDSVQGRTVKKAIVPFKKETIDQLSRLYNLGMVGIGSQYQHLIELAVNKTGLNSDQVKNWIRRQTFRKRHAPSSAEDVVEIPSKRILKKRRKTAWHQHLGEFVKTTEGSSAWTNDGMGQFIQSAKDAYSSKSFEEKASLQRKALEDNQREVVLTNHRIDVEGGKIFKKIQNLITNLEDIGYSGFCVAFHESKVQIASTSTAKHCLTDNFIGYIHSSVMSGNPPCCKCDDRINTITPSKDTSNQKCVSDIVSTASSTQKDKECINEVSNEKTGAVMNKGSKQTTKINEVNRESVKRKKKAKTNQAKNSGSQYWIPQLGLFNEDKRVLLSSTEWFNDNIINTYQELLKKGHPHIQGWQNTQLGKTLNFKVIDISLPFIQVLHVNGNHWITVSNIDCDAGFINVYDSSEKPFLSTNSLNQICTFLRHPMNAVKFGLVNTQRQLTNSDCGLFALAAATELAFGNHPDKLWFENDLLRQHVIKCFEAGKAECFPKRVICERNNIMQPYNTINLVSLYCTCRMPFNEKKLVIPCNVCKHFFHVDCVNPTVKNFICHRCQ